MLKRTIKTLVILTASVTILGIMTPSIAQDEECLSCLVKASYHAHKDAAGVLGAQEASRKLLLDWKDQATNTAAFSAWQKTLAQVNAHRAEALARDIDFPDLLQRTPGAAGLIALFLRKIYDVELKRELVDLIKPIATAGSFHKEYYAALEAGVTEAEAANKSDKRSKAISFPKNPPAKMAERYALYAPIAEEFGDMRGREQYIRWLLIEVMSRDLTAEERKKFLQGIDPVVNTLDDHNTARVLEVFEEVGGFSRLYMDAPSLAELGIAIVHHGNDNEARRTLLNQIEPLALAGKFDGQRYALMFDRLAENEGRPQRYGTQDMCNNGVRETYTLEPGDIDKRRARFGLRPIDIYLESLRDTYGPC